MVAILSRPQCPKTTAMKYQVIGILIPGPISEHLHKSYNKLLIQSENVKEQKSSYRKNG